MSTPTVSDQTRNRISNEAQQIAKKGLPLQAKSLLHWFGQLTPEEGKWAGQTFTVEIRLPSDYPDAAPKVRLLNRPEPRHPNFSPSGWPCLNILLGQWTDRETLISIWDSLEDMFRHPDYENGFTTDDYIQARRGEVSTPNPPSPEEFWEEQRSRLEEMREKHRSRVKKIFDDSDFLGGLSGFNR